ncbi:uncharacterized protein HaLaN_08905 [Haematococcus lacustris]|uniref:Uncharacterized protein n=1 Tax=Haematococcus lacustris TaxID=44745 RepID=A0A699Z273_HAELA|nr:uncharacterized protein HaLaN_08905 [Haematococcus lacustris]
MLWMTSIGLGLIKAKDIMGTARRLRVTQDVEVEIDRFENACAAARQKYDMMAPPEASVEERVTTAVDALCVLCLGLRDGEVPDADDARRLVDIVVGCVPLATADFVAAVVAQRGMRAAAYA